MKKEIKSLIEKTNEKVKNNDLYADYSIQYILSHRGIITDIIYANDSNVININPDTFMIKGYKKGYSVLDEILLPEIEKGKKIEYMTDEAHDYMWYILETYYPDDIENKIGMVKYLEYCKNNNITRRYLNDKFNSDPSDLLELYDTLHDYFKANELQVIMSKDYFDIMCEKNYFAFVLGYDLLHKMMKKYQHLDCDSNYDFCHMITDQFFKSDYYKDSKHSAYEMLCKYVEDNMEEITQSYLNYLGVEIRVVVPNKHFDAR